METLQEKMGLIKRHVQGAVSAVQGDGGASPVLRAVVLELQKKADKASGMVAAGNERTQRDAVIEVEQAADSAKTAAEADPGASEATKKAVLDAHMSFCLLKAETAAPK
jgi:hypothetical protein